MKRRQTLTMIALLLVAVFATTMMAGCGGGDSGSPEQDGEELVAEIGLPLESNDVVTLGNGSTVLTFEVTDDSGSTKFYRINTDADTVGAALLENGMIDGDETDFGLMVKSVNGLVADYDADGAYWAFYVDGDYAMAGVDQTEIEQGRVYALVYTKD